MSEAAPPAPPPPTVTVAPADVTVVGTGAGLQEAAAAHARDIEIRAHLDLRGLERPVNPDFPGAPTAEEPHALALLYARQGMRSMRGNCSDPGAAAALGLSSEDLAAAPLLPLKPRQCLVLVPDSFLMSNGGPFWLDNLYLRAAKTAVRSDFAFLKGGAHGRQQSFELLSAAELYVTNVTMQGEPRGTAVAIALEELDSTLLLADSVLSDWVGWRSPLNIWQNGIANVVGTVFRNMRLTVELADVSHNGAVRFANVSLANVDLQAGAVVSTTDNDGALGVDVNAVNFPEDDAEYDVELTPVPVPDRGVFGAEFRIDEAVMSDCMYMLLAPDVVNPGCPPSSVQARQRVRHRGQNPALAFPDYNAVGVTQRFADNLLEDTAPWLQAMRDELGPLPPPPRGWPQFLVDPPEKPVVREGIKVMVPVEEGLLVPGLREGGALPPPQLPRRPVLMGDRGGRGNSIAVAGVLGVLVVIAAVAGVVAAHVDRRHRRRRKRQPLRELDMTAVPSNPLRAWLTFWMSDGYQSGQATRAATSSPVGSSVESVPRSGDARLRGVQPRPPGVRLRPAAAAIPASAMNPDYEYALPTELARLMGAPILETEEQELLAALKLAPRQTLRKGGPGAVSGSGSMRTAGSLAATQPVGQGSQGGSHSLDDSASLGTEGVPRPVSATEPFAGVASAGVEQVVSLGARSDDPGSTVVVAPYNVTHGTCSMRSASMQSAAARAGTLEGPMTMSSGEGGSGAHVAGGPGQNRGACAHAWAAGRGSDTHAVSDAAPAGADGEGSASWRTSGTLPAVETARPVIHGIRMGRMHDADEFSAVRSASNSTAVAGAGVPAKAAEGRASCKGGAAVGPGPPGRDSMIARLQRQLDGFREGELFLGRLEMLGRQHRRCGGQAVVQFAEEASTQCDYAVKFFLDWDSFLTEAALYAAAFPHLRSKLSPAVLARADATAGLTGDGAPPQMSDVVARFLPQVEAVCDGAAGGLVDPRGRPLPPCIVMEKGGSLHDWSDRAEPDLFTHLAVLSNISLRLADMHDAGYVHRDLKPANVMWLPRQNRWTVIDFGCVARVGEAAPLSFTLAYAAPEVVRAYFLQRRSIESAPALDAWSLGVMAFELLTGAPPFDVVADGRVGARRAGKAVLVGLAVPTDDLLPLTGRQA